MDLTLQTKHGEKIKENKKRRKYLNLAWELRMLGIVVKSLERRTEKVRNWRTNRGHLNSSIVKTGQSIKKNPEET